MGGATLCKRRERKRETGKKGYIVWSNNKPGFKQAERKDATSTWGEGRGGEEREEEEAVSRGYDEL